MLNSKVMFLVACIVPASALLADPPELDASKMWRSAAKLAFRDSGTGEETILFFEFRTRAPYASIVPHEESQFSWAPINGPTPRIDLFKVQSDLVAEARASGKLNRIDSDLELIRIFAEKQAWSSDYTRLTTANRRLCHVRSEKDHRDIVVLHHTMNAIVLLCINHESANDDQHNYSFVEEVLPTLLYGLGA